MTILDTPTETADHTEDTFSAESHDTVESNQRSWAAVLSLVAAVAGTLYMLFVVVIEPAVISPVVIPVLGLVAVVSAIVALINMDKNPGLKGRDWAFGGLVLGAFAFFAVFGYAAPALAALVAVIGMLTPPVQKLLTK